MVRIKKALCSALAAAMFLFSPCAAFAENTEAPDFNVAVNAPPQIVFVGDSITAGYGLEGYSPDNKLTCDSFANILSRDFEKELPAQAEFSSWNEGRDGRTSAQLLELLQSGKLDDELKEADAVVVSIGGNDMLGILTSIIKSRKKPLDAIEKVLSIGADLDTALDGFEKNMPLIADELNSRTDGQIFVQTLYDPLEDTGISMLNDLAAEKFERFNSIIAAASENGTKYKLCDVFTAFKGKAKELTKIEDYDIHPNAEGHKVLAQVIGRELRAQTYYYHDYEAEREYLAEQERIRAEQERLAALAKEQEEIENARREQSRKIAVGAAAGAGAALVLGALLIRRGKRGG